jgi:hypothetical protein
MNKKLWNTNKKITNKHSLKIKKRKFILNYKEVK